MKTDVIPVILFPDLMCPSSSPLSFIHLPFLPGLPLLPTLSGSSSGALTSLCLSSFHPIQSEHFQPATHPFSHFSLLLSHCVTLSVLAVLAELWPLHSFVHLITSFRVAASVLAPIYPPLRTNISRQNAVHTSLHQHGDLAASGTFAQQVHHLVVAHILDVPLVDLH